MAWWEAHGTSKIPSSLVAACVANAPIAGDLGIRKILIYRFIDLSFFYDWSEHYKFEKIAFILRICGMIAFEKS